MSNPTSKIQNPWVLLILLLALVAPQPAAAHSGPPFIALPEQAIGPYKATVWADPDVGQGSFIVEATLNGATTPQGTTVTLWVQPADKRLPEAGTPAQRQNDYDDKVFLAEVAFDTVGAWQTRVVLEGPGGRGEASFAIQVTPDRSGLLTNLLCLLPFIGLAALWLFGLRKQRRASAIPGTSEL